MSERVVAVVGCGFVGSTAARLAAEAGATVLAIDKSPRPYGELESQVPGWLAPTVGAFIGRIDENLAHENIHFVPRTELGRDVSRDELESLGLSVIEATGRVPEALAPALEGRDLVTHGRLVEWFNRRGHLAFPGPELVLPAHVAVLGAGLGAVDAARLLSLELHQRALAARGHTIGLERLWTQGVDPSLRQLGPVDLPSVTLIVPGGRDALLSDAPAELRGQALEALEQRDRVTLLPGFEVRSLSRSEGRLTGLWLTNPRAEGFEMSLPCELLVDARARLSGGALEVFERLPADLTHALWELRLIPARTEEAAIARGAALAEALAEAVAELVRPSVELALAASPTGTPERAMRWARTRQAAVGFSDYVDFIGQTRRSWLY